MTISNPHSHKPRDKDIVLKIRAARRQRVLVYCQSSLGIGHSMRTYRLITALATRFEVTYLAGGAIPQARLLDNVEVVNLPDVVTDAEFTTLTGDTHRNEHSLRERKRIALETMRRVRPDAVLVELYPFGRGKFRREIESLLELAHEFNCKVVCSVRDILVQKPNQPAFESLVIERLNRYFDLVLIHSDPSLITFDSSFSRLPDINAPMVYTGYVAPAVPTTRPRKTEIVISIGGGRFGHELAFAAIEAARAVLRRIPHTFTLYTGVHCPTQIAFALRQRAASTPNIRVSDFCDNLCEVLARASLSISLGGYNTTMDVFASKVPAMMYPAANNGGMDQLPRLRLLHKLGRIRMIEEHELEPDRLANLICDATRSEFSELEVDCDGAQRTLAQIETLLQTSRVTEAL